MNKHIPAFLTAGILMVAAAVPALADSTPPSAPVWAATPAIVFLPSQAGLFWTASTDDVGVAGYYIYRCLGSGCQLPGEPTYNVNQAVTAYTDAKLNAATTYTYALAAYDAAGNISARSSTITVTTTGTVSAIVPVLTIGAPVNGITYAGSGFTLTMASSTASGSAVSSNSSYSWLWDFGDGTTMTRGITVTHNYANPGNYTVRLTVFNVSSGEFVSAEKTLTVLPAAVSNLALRLSLNGVASKSTGTLVYGGDIADYSGNQLSVQGGTGVLPAFVSGVTGLGMYGDGTANGPYVTVSDGGNNILDGVPAATIALYAKKTAASATGTIIVKQGVYSLALGAPGVNASVTNSNGTTVTLSSATVTNNDTNWHHYALTCNGTTVTLYFDGAAVASQSLSGSLAHAPSANVLVGKTISGNTFNGVLDTVRIYNTALSLAQIQSLYNGTLYGDVNGDGSLTIFDALMTAQYSVGLIGSLTAAQTTQADANGDGSITIYDALLIAQKSVNLILKLPVDVNEE